MSWHISGAGYIKNFGKPLLKTFIVRTQVLISSLCKAQRNLESTKQVQEIEDSSLLYISLERYKALLHLNAINKCRCTVQSFFLRLEKLWVMTTVNTPLQTLRPKREERGEKRWTEKEEFFGPHQKIWMDKLKHANEFAKPEYKCPE